MDRVADKSTIGLERKCVFCGISNRKKVIYLNVAEELGTELVGVKRGIDLVYGGESIRLMSKVVRALQNAGGHVVGVMSPDLMPKEVCGNTVWESIDMDQRKADMAHVADAFINLPDGFGTLEEVLERITWAQLRIHKKPVN